MKPKRSKVTFPRARGKGQRSDSNFWYWDQCHVHFSRLCPASPLFSSRSKNEVIAKKVVTLDAGLPGSQHLPSPFPQRGSGAWMGEGRVVCCVVLWLCLAWLLGLLTFLVPLVPICCFLISFTGSWFSLYPYIFSLECLRPSLLNHLQLDDTQINICGQSFFPLASEACGSSKCISPVDGSQIYLYIISLLPILFQSYNICRSI